MRESELDARLERLEVAARRARALTVAIAVAALGGLALGLGGGTAPTQDLRVRRLLVEDAEGRIRMELFVSAEASAGGQLRLLDAEGRAIASIEDAGGGVGALLLGGGDGGAAVAGTRDGDSSLTLGGKSGRVSLSVQSKSGPTIRIVDKDWKELFRSP